MPAAGYPPVAPDMPDERQHRIALARAVNGNLAGRLNVTSSVTLTASGTATALTDPRIGATTVALLEPATASAATARASVYQTFTARNTITLTHASNAATDQVFAVVLLG